MGDGPLKATGPRTANAALVVLDGSKYKHFDKLQHVCLQLSGNGPLLMRVGW